MNKIISKEHFSEKVFKLVIEAPLIAKSRKAGHFVIVRVGEKGERMPLTIAEADPVKAVSYTHLRAHETGRNLVCRLLLEKKNDMKNCKKVEDDCEII